MSRTNNYEISKDNARKLFLDWDQAHIIERCGLRADEEYLYIDFLGQPFRILRATGEAENLALGRAANFEEALSIYDYLCRRDPLPGMSGAGRSINSLKHVAQSNPSPVSYHQKWAIRYQEHTSALERVLSELGSPFPKGDIACVFPIFPGFDAVFQFWEGDDEFPPAIHFLWDENAPDYLYYETLYYVMGCFLDLLDRRVAELEKND